MRLTVGRMPNIILYTVSGYREDGDCGPQLVER